MGWEKFFGYLFEPTCGQEATLDPPHRFLPVFRADCRTHPGKDKGRQRGRELVESIPTPFVAHLGRHLQDIGQSRVDWAKEREVESRGHAGMVMPRGHS